MRFESVFRDCMHMASWNMSLTSVRCAVDPTASATQNETAGKEPVSGLEGKGTATEPFDLGNSGT